MPFGIYWSGYLFSHQQLIEMQRVNANAETVISFFQ